MISLIQPSRNNKKYLIWSYNSVRKNSPPEVEICVADDFSNDGTWEWCQETMKKDPFFKAIRNDGPNRLGHTILYDRLINEVATNDIVGIWHADMYMTPGCIEGILSSIKPKTIVSLTRVEPPLHPPGPEKIIKDFGTEPELFNENEFLKWSNTIKDNKVTNGVFAPWFIYKSDFQEIGGHDKLFAPQSKEDSDIWNRLLLNGCQFIQLWDCLIYHMTCRGSRFNPTLTEIGKNSEEWETQNIRSYRNFVRKWGSNVKHDSSLHPIVSHKYNIGFVIRNCEINLLYHLEPWCDNIYIQSESDIRNYIKIEQPNTLYDLSKRVLPIATKPTNDIVVEFDRHGFGEKQWNFIHMLSDVLTDSAEVGSMNYDIFTFTINKLTTYENSLIKVNNGILSTT